VIVTTVVIGHVGNGHHGIARRDLIAPHKRPTGKTAQSGPRYRAGRQVNATRVVVVVVVVVHVHYTIPTTTTIVILFHERLIIGDNVDNDALS
jgi:hypothetical protein